ALTRPRFPESNSAGREPTADAIIGRECGFNSQTKSSSPPSAGRRLVSTSPFLSFASSLVSRFVTQLEHARVAERHFRHHRLVMGRDGTVARIVVHPVFAQELRHKDALVAELSKAAPEVVILPADILRQDRVAAGFEQP